MLFLLKLFYTMGIMTIPDKGASSQLMSFSTMIEPTGVLYRLAIFQQLSFPSA
jgi:hypothetical protein